MDLEKIKLLLEQYAPQTVLYVLAAMGAMVVLGRIYVKMTPNQDDDQWLQKLEEKPVIGQALSLLVYFSPVARVEKPVEKK